MADVNSPAALEYLGRYAPDYLLCSWTRLLGPAALTLPRRFVIGSHPTALPHNRGRHPLHWAIVLGLTQTQLSFFCMDEGVDTGPLLLQIPVVIEPTDTVDVLVQRVNAAAYTGMRQLCQRLLAEPAYAGQAQNQAEANYWRKRTPHDVMLDFRMSTEVILRTVRSFAPPYPGAIVVFRQHVLRIVQAEAAGAMLSPEALQRLEFGKVVSVAERHLLVRAADGLVALEAAQAWPAELKVGQTIHPPSRYFADWPEALRKQLEA